MQISKSMDYNSFINAVNNSFHVEWSPLTATVSVVCVDSDYYEVDTKNESFGKLKLIAANSYESGTLLSDSKRKFMNNIKHDVELKKVKNNRCVISMFNRVGMYYA